MFREYESMHPLLKTNKQQNFIPIDCDSFLTRYWQTNYNKWEVKAATNQLQITDMNVENQIKTCQKNLGAFIYTSNSAISRHTTWWQNLLHFLP